MYHNIMLYSIMYYDVKCRDIPMAFITFMIFSTHGNVIFDILEPPAFQKYNTCWVL